MKKMLNQRHVNIFAELEGGGGYSKNKKKRLIGLYPL